MLTTWPANNKAIAVSTIQDITESKPIPKGAVVEVQDYDPCDKRWIIEYKGHI